MSSERSAYAVVGPRLIERGYCALPVGPGTKRPSTFKCNEWAGINNWREEYTRRLPTDFEVEWWSSLPGAGVGIVCGPASKNIVGIDVDTDDGNIASAIRFALPHAYLIKRGKKGDTRFFHAPDITASKSWNIVGAAGEKTRACDLIGPGRFTVLPPTIHPDTKVPYRWVLDALENTYSDELPVITSQNIAEIDKALAEFGFEPEPERPAITTGGSYHDATPHRALNNQALANLGAWVPGLGLYRCRQTRNGFEAVATWRPSSTGRPVQLRKLNLKISPRGIVDFGHGPQGYTALDLIMAAQKCDLEAAFCYLADALGWGTRRVIITEQR